MVTEVDIEGNRFLINGELSYRGRNYDGRVIEGLLFNSRMVQAIFDDENPETIPHWRYPDTGTWDADRNTDEFCAMLPEYRSCGLLGVTIGLQGGGSIYTPEIYSRYLNSAYTSDGEFKSTYFERLRRVLDATNRVGMVVIVNYFYWIQARRIRDARTIRRITEEVTEWLLQTGYRNILVDIMNEAEERESLPTVLNSSGIGDLIEITQHITLNGRRLLVGSSTGGGDRLPVGKWLEIEDFHMPHGNGCLPDELRAKLRRLKEADQDQKRPRPILINEDTIFLDNLDAAIDEYCSWGFYAQGYGSQYKDRMDWTAHGRENQYENLSGFQTLPVNWRINDPFKHRFFERLREITGGVDCLSLHDGSPLLPKGDGN